MSIDLSDFNSNKDIVIGVKRVSGDEKGRMYASLVKLKNRKDAASIEKHQGIKNTPKIDSLENCDFDISNGIAKLSNANAVNSASKPLILYIELNDQTNLRLFMNDGNTVALNDSGIYRNGKFEAIPMENSTRLLLEFLNMKVLDKYREAGYKVKVKREEKN